MSTEEGKNLSLYLRWLGLLWGLGRLPCDWSDKSGWLDNSRVCVWSHVIIRGNQLQGMPTQHHTWSHHQENGNFGIKGKL